jgi:hypothetical protein
MKIKYHDEADLQRKIVKILNRQGFSFKKAPSTYFCDLVDNVNKIYVEVKLNEYAPAQILYGIAKENKTDDVDFIGLANSFEIRFYEKPSKILLENFAKKIDPTFTISPSGVNNKKRNDEAFNLLGDYFSIYMYDGKFDLKDQIKEVFITENNYEYFEELFKKYNIPPKAFLFFLQNIYHKNQEIVVNREGRIINISTATFMPGKKTKPIINIYDKNLIEKIRIRSKDLNGILHQIQQRREIKVRRSKGQYFTKSKVSIEISEIIKKINPDFIIEPYVGAGSLIDPLLNFCPGAANDIDKEVLDLLKKDNEGLPWIFTNVNTVTTKTEDLIKLWNVPKDKNVLILTNPPFGASSGNILVSKKNEIKNDKKSRKIKIDYAELGDIYGRGDLVLPAIGRLIEIIKTQGKGYLALFTPGTMISGRPRYKKVLKALLKDFEFIKGYFFTGKNFKDVSTNSLIPFTIWKYHENNNMNIESLNFTFNKNIIKFKRLFLAKDGWKMNGYKNTKGEPGVGRFDSFNKPGGKFIRKDTSSGGSELVPENVKIDLKIPNVPSELVYGLWSTCVGTGSATSYPLYMDGAFIHLPNFQKKETHEIFAYLVIYGIIRKKYYGNMIGFIGPKRIFKFGGKQLTDGAKYLIDTYGYCAIGNKTIDEVFTELKNMLDGKKIDKNYRNLIKKEIEKRLETIGYWDYIPIPENF